MKTASIYVINLVKLVCFLAMPMLSLFYVHPVFPRKKGRKIRRLRLNRNEPKSFSLDPAKSYLAKQSQVQAVSTYHIVEEENILPSAGEDDGLWIIFSHFNGRKVILLDPEFVHYKRWADSLQLRPTFIPLGFPQTGFLVQRIMNNITTKTGLIVLSTIGNPSLKKQPFMSRIVSAKLRSNGLIAEAAAGARAEGTGKKQGNDPKEYFERLVKYIPVEILAAFTAINGFLAGSPENIKYWGFVVNLIICAVFTPIYFKLISDKEDDPNAVKKQIVISFFAFLVWAYSISGESGIFGPKYWNIYYSGVSSALIVLFSLVTGAIIPRYSKPNTTDNAGDQP